MDKKEEKIKYLFEQIKSMKDEYETLIKEIGVSRFSNFIGKFYKDCYKLDCEDAIRTVETIVYIIDFENVSQFNCCFNSNKIQICKSLNKKTNEEAIEKIEYMKDDMTFVSYDKSENKLCGDLDSYKEVSAKEWEDFKKSAIDYIKNI